MNIISKLIEPLLMVKVTFNFKSGAKYVIYCKNFNHNTNSNNDLISYSCAGLRDNTHTYIRMDDVSFISAKVVFRWFK